MARDVGVVNGRMHPPHLGHMEYLLKANQQCDYLIVGITNPDPRMTVYDEADPERSSDEANPFTYYERFQMVKRALLSEDVSLNEFDIVPFPINYPRLLQYYIPENATHFITIYDEWGYKKKEVLEGQGLGVKVLWKRDPSEKVTTGTAVREAMATGDDWESVVPDSVVEYIVREGLENRVKDLKTSDSYEPEI